MSEPFGKGDKNGSSVYISVVCPVFNEEGNLVRLHKRIIKSLKEIGKSFEVIFINDGSNDRSYDVAKQLKPLKIINFRKNFGQTAALDCGIKEAKGKYIITLDSDLQNDPGDFKILLEKAREGYDVVSGWRKNRKDSLGKKIISRGAEILRKFFINDGIHDSGCTLKIYRRECFLGIDLFGEMHRFIPAVLKIQGFKIAEIPVRHHPRSWGQTKYGLSRTLKGFLDMISVWFWNKYSSRPLHLFGGIGVLLFGFGALLLIYLAMLKVFLDVSLSDKIWPMISVFMMLAGIQFLVSGLLADIAIKSYYGKENMNYVIKDKVENR
jgi:glycosyltransferase involved in cell wall biosynthesis